MSVSRIVSFLPSATELLYEFGVQGLKIDEPTKRDSLDYYRDEKIFLQRDYAVSAYFPINLYVEKKKSLIINTFEENFKEQLVSIRKHI